MPDRPGILLLSCPDAEELAAGLATRWGGQVAIFPFSDLPSVDEMAEHCRRHGLDALLLVGDTLPLCLPPEYAPAFVSDAGRGEPSAARLHAPSPAVRQCA